MKTKGFDAIFEEKEIPLETQWVASGTAAIKESNPAAVPEPGDPVEEAIDREIKYEGIYGDGPIAKARQRDETAMIDRIRTAYRADRCRSILYISGYLSESENAKVKQRIDREVKRKKIDVKRVSVIGQRGDA